MQTDNASAADPAAAAAATPSAAASVAAPAGRTPWRTPAPVFADPKTPATAAAAAGWQQLYSDGGDEDALAGGALGF